jgi:large subunit ribosomal protein L10e
MLAHKLMEEKIPGQYYFEVKVYPHHFIRENKMAAGAGADRMATGMTQSFGIVIGRMALVSPNQVILFASCPDEKTAAVAKQCMTTVKSKFPCATKVVISKID